MVNNAFSAILLGGLDALTRPLGEPDSIWTIASAWHAWTERFESGEKGNPRCAGA